MRILDCLDVSELPKYERLEYAAEAAACLKEILDRVELPPYDEIPDTEAIEAAGGAQELSRWRIPGTRITIARVEEGPQRHEYLFSPGSVERAVEYYRDVKSLPYRTEGPQASPGLYQWYLTSPASPTVARVVDWLPDWWREQTLEMARWKWAGLVLAALVAVFLMGVAYRLYSQLADRYRDEALFRYCLTIVLPIFAVLVALYFKRITHNYVTLRGAPLYFVSFIANLTALLASLVVVFGASNRIAALIMASPKINPQGLDAQFIRIFARLVSVVLAVIIFLEGGRYLGIPVTTLIASAGVGGLAVALAAQDTLKNLFGTIMLLTDKPFRVGERIIFGKYDGVVEDIGLRSTRLRLLNGHQATIPNDELARTDIENIGRRPYIRRAATIELPSGTPAAKIKRALEILRKILENHEGMAAEYPPRVFLRDVNEGSLGILMMYWYHPPEYWQFLAFSERVSLQMSEQLEAEGITFAAPALTVRMAPDEKPPER
jgi:MscS family membrane protein